MTTTAGTTVGLSLTALSRHSPSASHELSTLEQLVRVLLY